MWLGSGPAPILIFLLDLLPSFLWGPQCLWPLFWLTTAKKPSGVAKELLALTPFLVPDLLLVLALLLVLGSLQARIRLGLGSASYTTLEGPRLMSWKERQCSQTTKCQLIVIGANSTPRGFTICGVVKEGSLLNVNSSIVIQQSYGEAQ